MPSICLSQTSGSYKFKGSEDEIKVTDGNKYKLCTLFVSCKHTFTVQKKGDISIFKSIPTEWNVEGGKYLTIKVDKTYEEAILESVDVFYNHCERERMVLLLLFRYKCAENIQNLYYISNDLYTEIQDKHEVSIEALCPYLGEKEILDVLFSQNKIINKCPVYELDKENSGSNFILYDDGNICLSPKENINEDETKRFYTHTHKPTEKCEDTRAYVLYQRDALLSYDSSKMGSYHEVPNIQYTKYVSITVYRSTKLDTPLMAEFVTKGYHKEEHEYYIQKNYKHIQYWQRLYSVNYEELMGEKIKDEQEIHRKLSDPSTGKLLNLLDKIEFFLTDTIYVLLDFLKTYDERTIGPIIKGCDPKLVRSTKITDAQPDPIQVKKQECKVLEQFGFSCYMHKFSIHDNYESGEITLLMPTEEKDKYQELKLLKEEGSAEPDYLFYNNAKGQVYVYYYTGTSSGPLDRRPLLVCYNGNAYAALDADGYSSSWYRLKCAQAKYDYMCPEEQFVQTLCRVLGFLNPVKLEQRPEDDEMTVKEPNKQGESQQRKAYVLQKYRGEEITVDVTYSNLACYRCYTHAPMDSGHRLGTISYCGSSEGAIGISYDLTKPLTKVHVYYNVYDGRHEYPILVVLEFSQLDRQYFRLKSRDEEQHLLWEEFSEHAVDPDHIEQTLSTLRRQMGVVFYERVRTGTLFDPSACHEYSNKGPIIGVLACLSVLGLCGGLVYFKYPTLMGPLYKRFY